MTDKNNSHQGEPDVSESSQAKTYLGRRGRVEGSKLPELVEYKSKPIKSVFNSSDEPIINEHGTQMLEGDNMQVVVPADWENTGTSFDVNVGRRKSLIESVYSTEIDGGLTETLATKKRPTSIILIAIIALVLTVGGGAAYFLYGRTTPPTDGGNATNLFAKALPKAPTPGTLKVSFTGNSNSFITTEQRKITIPGSLKLSTEDCKIVNIFDWCKVGTVNLPTKEVGSVYYTRDLVRSPVFKNAQTYKKIKVPNTILSADTTINFAGVATRFLVFILPNSDGWFISIPTDLPQASVTSLLNKLELSS